jgi:indole-3-glycerol phosphate synthase
MVQSVPDILARIVEQKQRELDGATVPRAELERLAAANRLERRDFAAALLARPPAIIAEIKKASPSKGLLAPDFDPRRLARDYQAGGAACLSVLTDREFFQGSLENLEAARAEVSLPVLRKDFTTSDYHVAEAAAHGADAILLIAAILSEAQMRDYRELAESYGMAALVEVHADDELDAALASGARIVGVNNRNLRTFEVTLETAVRLNARIPEGIIKVAESGIHDAADVHRLSASGFHAFLVGEHLVKSGDPRAALENLRR